MPASEAVSHTSTVLIFNGGVRIGDGSAVIGVSLLSYWCPMVGTIPLVAQMLKGFGGSFKSVKLVGIIATCLRWPLGMFGSFQS